MLSYSSTFLFIYPAISCHLFPFSWSHASGYLPIYLPLISLSPQVLPYSRVTTEVSPRSYLLYYIFTYFIPSLLLFLHIFTLVGSILPRFVHVVGSILSLFFWSLAVLKCVSKLIESNPNPNQNQIQSNPISNPIQSDEKELPVERFELMTWKNSPTP